MAVKVDPIMTEPQIISSAADFQAKIEAKRYDYFTFPDLEVTIRYRKPDIIKLALNKSLPSVMADAVINSYKANIEGRSAEFQEELKQSKIEADDKLLNEFREQGYTLLSELCVSHRIMDVPESDFSNNVISWNDIPEQDAIAFLINLINKSQTSATTTGGEISTEEVISFPDSERQPKRNTTRTRGQDVRVPAA